MALESYGVYTSYWFRKFLVILYDLKADFKILSVALKYEQQMFSTAAFK
jgi:hypothetical protein